MVVVALRMKLKLDLRDLGLGIESKGQPGWLAIANVDVYLVTSAQSCRRGRD
jgi:hypothetical protein